MAADKSSGGGWRSRFGKKSDGSEAQADSKYLERQRSVDVIRQNRSGRTKSLLGFDGDRDTATEQTTTRQSRAANDNKYSSVLGILDGRTLPASFEEHQHSRAREDGAASKLDRMKGEPSRSASNSSSLKAKSLGSEVDVEQTSCPVCLELLSFRLAGEKTHVTPSCGHALHHACFTAVYGSPEVILAAQNSPGRTAPPGMCGVCRTLIVLGDEGESRRQNSELTSFILMHRRVGLL